MLGKNLKSKSTRPSLIAEGGRAILQSPLLSVAGWAIPYPAGVFLAWLTAAFLFCLLAPYSNFASQGYLDPWFYTGYFTHFSYLLQHNGLTYYVSRLPWIIPGLLAFKLFTPTAASVILNALLIASSTTCLFWIVAWNYGTLPAVLAGIALMTNPYFIAAVSWDYPDGPAIAYAFAALACFLSPRPWRIPNASLGGAFLALSGYSNLAGLAVLIAIFSVLLWRYKRTPVELTRQITYVAYGGIIVTFYLGLIAKWLIHTYLFFLPQIWQIQNVTTHPEYLANMWGTGNAWIPVAYRLAPALMILLLGAVIVLARPRVRSFGETYLCLAVSSALYCLFEFQFHNVGLRVNYGTTYLMCPLFACAGTLLGECMIRTEVTRDRIVWAAVALFGLALPFWFRALHPSSNRGFWIEMLAVGILGAALVIASRMRGIAVQAVACCLIFAGLFAGPAWDRSLGYIWSPTNRSVFDSLMRLEQVVDAGVAPERKVLFWYDAEPSHSSGHILPGNLFDSLNAVYVQGHTDLTKLLPSEPLADLKNQVQPDTTLVHLTLDPEKLAQRTSLLAGRGIITGKERSWTVDSPVGRLSVILQDVADESHIH